MLLTFLCNFKINLCSFLFFLPQTSQDRAQHEDDAAVDQRIQRQVGQEGAGETDARGEAGQVAGGGTGVHRLQGVAARRALQGADGGEGRAGSQGHEGEKEAAERTEDDAATPSARRGGVIAHNVWLIELMCCMT